MKGNKILVTGASSGIGLAISKMIAEQGGKVVLISRNEDNLELAFNSLARAEHEYYAADVTDQKRISEVIKESYTKSGSFDGLVHSAGMHQLRPLQATKLENIEEVLNANISSIFIVAKSFIKKANKERASIVLISSTAAIKGTAGVSVYSASKGAVLAATRSLAVELSVRNIRVNSLVPGMVDTPMTKTFLSSLNVDQKEEIINDHLLGIGNPDDVANSALFLLSNKSKWITGTGLVVDGGLSCK